METRRREKGFTLVELLIAMSVLTLIVTLVASVISTTQEAWITSKGRVTQFRDARLAFELVTRTLAQATLNTYYDYGDDYYLTAGDFALPPAPTSYTRESELQFRTGAAVEIVPTAADLSTHMTVFYAPLGYTASEGLHPLNSLFNARGYYVQWGDDSALRPAFLSSLAGFPTRQRFRLMEFVPPSENLGVYDVASPEKAPHETWFDSSRFEEFSRPVADNIIALILSPRESPEDTSYTSIDQNGGAAHLAPEYAFDSRLASNPGSSLDTFNLLPPLVQVTLIAIDEVSALRIEALTDGSTTMPALVDPSWFRKVSDYEKDLEALTARLRGEDSAADFGKLNYRVFTATVALRAAKWSP